MELSKEGPSRAGAHWSRLRRRAALSLVLAGAYCGLLPAQNPASQEKADPPKLLTFRLGFGSLTPNSVKIPPGRYQLKVLNTVIVGAELPIRLEREDGSKTADARVRKNSAVASSVVDLTAGTYVLHVGNRKQWRSEIVVTAKEK